MTYFLPLIVYLVLVIIAGLLVERLFRKRPVVELTRFKDNETALRSYEFRRDVGGYGARVRG